MILRRTYAYSGKMDDINFMYKHWHYDFTKYAECINSVAIHNYISDLDMYPSYVPVAQILSEPRT